METLVKFAQFEIWFLLGGLALVVAYKMLTGKINTTGLLKDKETGAISPGRVQLLLFTLMGAGSYLGMTATLAAEDPPMLPDVPDELLLVVTGSNLVYLGGKSYSRWTLSGLASRLNEILRKGEER